ncbi:hypothetical protein QWM81_20130 [Streptomyces ficellus]|uniref:Uncharacterized protein n=1 Tax=Streptomyces ficellus TaxID=1977088 RepID=A0ABT7Z9Z2_9ACTN|nr:hypothetical protein [Streptomyces ficellus]MDN3296331.1 hypothetical protein [Streptomyces ficellus]
MAPPAQTLEAMSASVQKHIATVWPRTGGIWPGVDFSEHSVILTDGKAAYVLDKDGRRPVSVDTLKKRKVALPTRPGSFNPITWEGKKSLILWPRTRNATGKDKDPTGFEPADAALNTFGLATHEEFHPYVQHGGSAPWRSLQQAEKDAGQGDRDTVYPVRAEPRIQRAMVYNSLLAAYKEPDRRAQHLAAAAYWQRTWARANPDEAQASRPVELLEGTAKYFEVAAVAMAETGSADPAKTRAHLRETLQPMKLASKAFEPYAIGAAALLNADAMGLGNVKKTLTTTYTTPLDQVLRGIRPATSAQAPADVRRGIEDNVRKTNESLSKVIDPFVKAMADDSTPMLLIPIDATSESVGAEGFYTTEELPVTIIPGFRLTFDKLTSGKLTINRATVGILDLDGKGYYALPLSLDGTKNRLDDRRLTLDTPRISGTVTVTTRTDDGKRSYIAQ